MAVDFMPDDFIETFEDETPMESFDGSGEPMLEGALDITGEDANHGRVVEGENGPQQSTSERVGGSSDMSSSGGGVSSTNGGSSGSHVKSSSGGGKRNKSERDGHSKRGERDKGASGENTSGKAAGSKSRKRKAEDGQGDNPAPKRKAVSSVSKGPANGKSDNTTVEIRRDEVRRSVGQVDSNATVERKSNADPVDRRTRYITNILSMQREMSEKKEKRFTGKTVDLILLDEKIHEVKGIKCHSLDAFIIANKQQLVCYGVFIDQDGIVSVGTHELEKAYRGLIENHPNLDIELSDDVKKRLNRKWWKVPNHMHKKIMDALSESVVQHNGEKYFTMTLTGYYCGSMVDKDSSEKRVTFYPTVVFMPYKALIE